MPGKELHRLEGKPIDLWGNAPELVPELCSVEEKVLQLIKVNQKRQEFCDRNQSQPAELKSVKNDLEQLLFALYCKVKQTEGLQNKAVKRGCLRREKSLAVQVHSFMYDNINEKLTLERIARGLGMNVNTLRVNYKKETGKSIIRAFADMKTAEARMLQEKP